MPRRTLVILVANALVVCLVLAANRYVFFPAQATGPALVDTIPLPPEFPTDFPIYPGAVYLRTEAFQGQVNGRWFHRGWFAVYEDPTAIIIWYRDRLAKAGYPPVTSVEKWLDRRYGFDGHKNALTLVIRPDTNILSLFSVDFYAAPN